MTEPMQPTRYFDLSLEAKLKLQDQSLYDAIKVEAIHRGIKPPLALDAVLKQAEYVGYNIPPEAVVFYEIVYQGDYSMQRTGVCFRTAEAARNAFAGAIVVKEDGYHPNKQNKIIEGAFSVQEIYISTCKPKSVTVRIEEFFEDTTDFDKLAEECSADLRGLRQAAYDKEVRTRKREQYLSLAQGNEEIAKAFWNKTEQGEFPTQ